MSNADQSAPISGLLDGPEVSRAIPSLALVGAAAAIETYGCRATLPVAVLLLGHAAVVGILAGQLWRQYRAGRDLRLSAVALLTVGTAGPVGAIGTLITFLLHAVLQRRPAAVDQRFAFLFPELAEDEACATARLIAEGRRTVKTTSAVTAFAEIMEVGSFEDKQRAISHMSGRFRPEFAATLHRALGDPEPAIRVQAAILPGRIEKQFDEKLISLERQAATGLRPAIVALADHLDQMAHAGLLDEERLSATAERALGLYRSASADGPQGIEIALGRLLIRLGRDNEALTWFDQLPQSIWHAPRAMLWRLEALYRAGRLAELRSLCRSLQPELAAAADLPRKFHDIVTMWADQA